MEKLIDVFIKSYRGDFWILYYALDSIQKNVTGYNNVVLLIPETDKDLFDTRRVPERTFIHYVSDKSPGWMFQQVLKLNAYKYCAADYIMFSDSDCVFTRPINLQDCVTMDRPEILHTSWAKVGDALCWRKPTQEIMGEKVPWEGMRRNNAIYHRSTLVNLAAWKPDLEEQIMAMERFSEFNLMSAYAYRYEPEKYKFTDTDNWTYVPPLSEQVWSHSSKEGGETHLREWVRILETILLYHGIEPPIKSV